jgi:uncharacterized membrane protein (UPF0136 family)
VVADGVVGGVRHGSIVRLLEGFVIRAGLAFIAGKLRDSPDDELAGGCKSVTA